MDALRAAPPTLDSAPSASGLLPGWVGDAAHDVDGVRVGVVADVLFAPDGAPGWLCVRLPGDALVLAPARGLRHRARGLQLACAAERVQCAPRAAAPPDGVADDHARLLAAHYGVRCGAGPWHGVLGATVARRAA